MNCQILFTGKIKKNIINFSPVELAQRFVTVKFDTKLITISSASVGSIYVICLYSERKKEEVIQLL